MVQPGGRSFGETGVSPRPRVPTWETADAVGRGVDIHVVIPHGQELVAHHGQVANDDFFGDLMIPDMPIDGEDNAIPYCRQMEFNPCQATHMLSFAEFSNFEGLNVRSPQNSHPRTDATPGGKVSLRKV